MAHVVGPEPARPIRRLLVANRGEIARRIFRACRELGISTAAVYADDDAAAPFVAEADVAVALAGRSAAETYLDAAKLIAAAARAGADAIHPGYGFLSENADFARGVIEAGLTWIGPAPETIAKMGDKLAAKALMASAGVPTLAAAKVSSERQARQAARAIGYPVLIKAAAGGGGRGMRLVETEKDLRAALASARREAGAAFGDDTVFLERWVGAARHLEIQILGDRHGNLVHLFERECSIQRRHQKLIEESPSSALDEKTRAAMCAAALTAAKSLSYVSAGTVEFLLAEGEFWFLEVNARLQVEHPVTEAVTGADIVIEQIRIAQGEPLSFAQADLKSRGWAIEARVCAEDPERDFLPAPGKVLAWRASRAAPARFDSGVETGTLVSSEFDAMVAKVIAHAASRREAAALLARALETTRIQGLTTNRDFLVACLRSPQFLAGDTTTDFIDRAAIPRRRVFEREALVQSAIAAAMEAQARRRARARVLASMPTGWRNTPMPLEGVAYDAAGEEVALGYRAQRDGSFQFVVDGQARRVVVHCAGHGEADFAIDGLRATFLVDPAGEQWLVHGPAGDVELAERPRYPVAAGAELTGGLKAPMPGVIRAVAVKAGERVSRGQLLVVLEAMKMEHRILAPHDGVVDEVGVTVGEQVGNGQRLLSLSIAQAQAAE
ncbi:MAG TPA: biotin carboxylase N-terminal domain-containing protein [Caulobacteraceae bacterium]|nr:biotin carboxylase N-terminal domain-containing protein [Caulobacteraceae bacterium]